MVKTKFHHFWPPLEKLLQKSTSAPHEKLPSDAHAHKHVKLHHFLRKIALYYTIWKHCSTTTMQ